MHCLCVSAGLKLACLLGQCWCVWLLVYVTVRLPLSCGAVCESSDSQLMRHHDTLFSRVWPLEPGELFSPLCCGGLFSCSSSSRVASDRVTCVRCGHRHCDPMSGDPGCPGGICVPLGTVCDDHNDCGAPSAADEANCGEILRSYRVERRRAITAGSMMVHGVSRSTCAAICFYHDHCPFFSFAEFDSLQRLHIGRAQAGLGRAIAPTVCVIGCDDCGHTPYFNASSDLYRTTSTTQALRLQISAAQMSPHYTGDVTAPTKTSLLPQFPQCGRDRQRVDTFSRITGGANSRYGQHPWMAQIRRLLRAGRHPNQHACGGVIVSSRFILTAAHCMIHGETQYEVIVGQYDLDRVDSDEQVFGIKSRLIHPQYDRSNKAFDICLILLDKRRGEIRFSANVRPACLPESSAPPRPPQSSECVTAGWGADGSRQHNILRQLRLPLVSDSFCAAPEVYGRAFNASAGMLCAGYVAGGKDTCQGDSGGGLLCRQDSQQPLVLAGLVSKGGECGARNKPGIYTDVRQFRDWIVNTMSVLLSR